MQQRVLEIEYAAGPRGIPPAGAWCPSSSTGCRRPAGDCPSPSCWRRTTTRGRSVAATRRHGPFRCPRARRAERECLIAAAMPLRDAKVPSSVGDSVSSTVTRSVTLSTRLSPAAARCPSSVASVKPPAHAAIVLICGAARNLADDADGFPAGREVSLEIPVALRSGGIAPADGERRDTIVRGVLGEAAPGAQVERVELVDLRRHDQERALEGLGGGWLVLDQLQHLAAKHHGTRRRRQVLADLELAIVDLPRHAAVVEQVVRGNSAGRTAGSCRASARCASARPDCRSGYWSARRPPSRGTERSARARDPRAKRWQPRACASCFHATREMPA